MGMTRKDFMLVADAIAECPMSQREMTDVVISISKKLEGRYPSFDPNIFRRYISDKAKEEKKKRLSSRQSLNIKLIE